MRSTKNFRPDPPGIDKAGNSELQFKHIHCETTDNESEAES